MNYISIDGDDIGRKITACYLSNDEINLKKLSENLKDSILKVSDFLVQNKFSIIFCAADGVVASTDIEQDYSKLFRKVCRLSPVGITYSAGVGNSLHQAYIALLSAKSNGKNRLSIYSEFKK